MNIEQAINKGMELKQKNIRYSMYGSRVGTDGTADCSGFVYTCLVSGGATKLNYVPNTDSLHSFLINNGFKLIAESTEWTAKRGDVVIFGKKGSSGGANGHVVLFIEQYKVIHCTYKSETANGVYIESDENACPYNWYFYVYRLSNNTPTYKQPVNNSVNNSNYVTTFAKEVINGVYGNGENRKNNIYNAVQSEVNNIVNKRSLKNNHVTQMAKRVIQGKYGNGENRKNNIFNEIQNEVNRILKG